MSDLLRHGPDHEPPWWTSPVALAVAAAALVGLVLLAHGLLGRHARHSPAAEHPTRLRTPGGPASSVPIAVAPNVIPRPRAPTKFSGIAMSAGDGFQLLLGGPAPGLFSTATGRFQPVIGLPLWRPGYEFTRVAGGWAVQRYSPPQAICQECDAPPPVYFLGDQKTRAVVVASGYDATAAATPGDLWLTAYLPDANIGNSAGTVQEVTVTGHAVGRPSLLPSGYLIDRAVHGGLLLAPYSRGPGLATDELWNPAMRRVVHEFTNVIAASSDEIAWNPCTGACPLKIITLTTGETEIIQLPRGGWADGGTFSADGRLLAVQVSADIQQNGYAATTRIEVIAVAGRRLRVLAGTRVSSLVGVSFGWLAGSDRLVAAIPGPTGVVQLGSWQPGASHLSLQSVRLPDGASLVLGDSG